MTFKKARENAIEIFKEAVGAANPRRCVSDHVTLEGNSLYVDSRKYDLGDYRRIFAVAFGKAAASMGKAIEDVLGDRITEGIVVSNAQPQFKYSKLSFYLSSHPVPDERSVAAAKQVVSLVERAGEDDLVIFLISGGGSALLAMPAPGLRFEEKQRATEALLDSGVDKYGLNAVRKHISQIKGGGLLKYALPARVVTLILSNVVGDRMEGIASGPTVPDPTTFEDACRVVEAMGVEHKIPPQVVVHLEEGIRGNIPETLKEGEFDPERVQTVIVGSNFKSLKFAEQKARELGYNTLLLSSQVSGEAREVAKVIAAVALDVERFDIPIEKSACVIFGGETTVTVTGSGKGGRSTETALSFCMEIMEHNIVGLFCDTDGIDGRIDAAGAICDGRTRVRAREKNLSAREHLNKNNSYVFFDALGDLIRTGPTGTNVMDIGIVIVD